MQSVGGLKFKFLVSLNREDDTRNNVLEVVPFDYAAMHGSLKNRKWLHENGCPWDKRTFDCLARWGTLKTKKWLHGKEYPLGSQSAET